MNVPDQQKLWGVSRELELRAGWVIGTMARFGFPLGIVSGLRSQAEQDRLYAQGRTAPGAIVTWTRNSAHTSGRAVDFGFRVGGSFTYDVPDWWWDAVRWVAARAALRAAAWDQGDLGHFEF